MIYRMQIEGIWKVYRSRF